MSEGSIFYHLSDLKIKFDKLKQNLVERGDSRLLSQFSRSSLLIALLHCISEEANELYSVMIDMLQKRTLAEAEGENLDMLGELVGANRILYNYVMLSWLTPDDNTAVIDEVPVWSTNAPQTGDLPAVGEDWRQLIIAQIFKNHMLYASFPECRSFMRKLTGETINFIYSGMLEVQLCVHDGISPSAIRFLQKILKSVNIDYSYVLAIPPDVYLNPNVIIIAPNAFAPDRLSGVPDEAIAMIAV